MKKTLSTLLALAALTLPAFAQAPSLESAGNVKALVQDLKKDAKAEKVDFKPAAVTGIWTDTDCQKITFAPGGPNVSAPVALMSKTWIEECDQINFPYPPGGGTCIPRGRRLMTYDEANAVVELAERGTPAAQEVFEACLWGRSLSLRVKSSPFKYKWTEKGGRFTLTRKK